MNTNELYSQYQQQDYSTSRSHIDGHTDYHNDGSWEDKGYNYHTDTHNDIG